MSCADPSSSSNRPKSVPCWQKCGSVAEVVRPDVSVTAASDEDDNRLLEIRGDGQADHIVTGNSATSRRRESLA